LTGGKKLVRLSGGFYFSENAVAAQRSLTGLDLRRSS